jgi:PIN domain nuclease of toxin-antitoxin system
VKLLLDTHALIWALSNKEALRGEALAAMEDTANDVVVSAVSVWEIETARRRGRIRMPDDLLGALSRGRFEPLAITLRHAWAAGRLPLHHRDPFDRMLVAQAQLEGLTLVTRDRKLARYRVGILPA